ncbi:MAG TPA: TIGR03663 family protein [Phycisphaerae bacterium]|nr:TIGR03663 family protein [Phycisphaerae bacterium]HNU43898.1 TIGR03663 family protein [Phycisphaerae bacterium]
MKHGWAWALGLLAAMAAALALRLPQLDRRPMHGDEAVHTIKFDELRRTGSYHYDPYEYHGPTLYYLTLPSAWLHGGSALSDTAEGTFRIVPVLLGAGLLPLLWLLRDALGRAATLVAGVLTAVSPALVFYSRYYIQETVLLFFTLLTLAGGWRYVRSRQPGWAVLTGVGLGAMQATKETCIIVYAAFAGASLVTYLWERRAARGTADMAPSRRYGWWKGWVAVVSAAVLTSAILFSAFGTHPRGIVDAWLAYGTYLDRAGGGIHTHPWYYYLKLLLFTQYVPGPWWSEALIVGLAAVGTAAALAGRGGGGGDIRWLRFLAVYTLLLTGLYSAIPYKTPWCMLGFLHGMVLLAGVGAVALWRAGRRRFGRWALTLALAAGGAHLARQAYAAGYTYCADPRNPYVYAQPGFDVVRLGRRVEELARQHPDGRRMFVRVIASDCWPLPWYFRRLERVGYWESVPADADAPVIVCAAELADKLQPALRDSYISSFYGLRPDAALLLYVERGLWEKYLQHGPSGTAPTGKREGGMPKPKAPA